MLEVRNLLRSGRWWWRIWSARLLWSSRLRPMPMPWCGDGCLRGVVFAIATLVVMDIINRKKIKRKINQNGEYRT